MPARWSCGIPARLSREESDETFVDQSRRRHRPSAPPVDLWPSSRPGGRAYGLRMVLIAHVSDVHVDAGERSAERTGRVFRYLAGLPSPPDAVIVTGDIADHG